MVTCREEPTVNRTFVVNSANEGDPNFDHCDNLSRNLEDDDVPPIKHTITVVPCEQAIVAPLLTLDVIQSRDKPDAGDHRSVLESGDLPPEPHHFNMEVLRLLSLYLTGTSRYRRFRHDVHRKGAVLTRH
ncbi:hypothetical protein AnigIFM60653_001156 [Aspergillus niger]|nr:hypothetical protein AnigIFM60653_001156 [Aspergillus niger]